MEKNQFWPNIWYVDDHGGINPYRLEASKKEAQLGESVMDVIIPFNSKKMEDFQDLYIWLEKEDKPAADLLHAIYLDLHDKLADRNVMQALARLIGSIEAGQQWDGSLHRNNLAKAATGLGLDTPMSF